tara:strand:+ start:151 stop:918 length:768 start_codon:yes stop_codon:yes gene_type:complete
MQRIIIFLSLISLITFNSCSTRKKLVYFQQELKEGKSNYTPIFKTDDLLSVIITGENAESAQPFNLPNIGSPQALNSSYTTGNTERTGYLVDLNGNINIPILGSINVKGLSRSEVTKVIEQRMEKYITNPIVNIQILNYKISVLGDVKKPGTFKIPNERITLIEAIALSGDLKITGKRNNVLVIRDVDGAKKEFRIDLTSSEIFSSEVYYLEQNDVVYVEPNNTSRSMSTIWRSSGGIFISLTSLIITTINIITK